MVVLLEKLKQSEGKFMAESTVAVSSLLPFDEFSKMIIVCERM